MTNTVLEKKCSIHPSAVIHPSAEIGEGVIIGPNVVIGEGVKLGNGTRVIVVSDLVWNNSGLLKKFRKMN